MARARSGGRRSEEDGDAERFVELLGWAAVLDDSAGGRELGPLLRRLPVSVLSDLRVGLLGLAGLEPPARPASGPA